MNFTYYSYVSDLIENLKKYRYSFVDYHCKGFFHRRVILRHDIDFDIDAALKMAEMECQNDVRSTYFVMVTSDFYNVHSIDTRIKLRRIIEFGHEIGVHYDELAYPGDIGKIDKIQTNILHEGKILEETIGTAVTTVSMHRPSKEILKSNIEIPGFVNSYNKEFFNDYKYVSDSRRRWREPIEEYIEEEKYERLHILTHPFWYKEEETGLTETLQAFVKRGSMDRYDFLDSNFTNLSNELSREDINE